MLVPMTSAATTLAMVPNEDFSFVETAACSSEMKEPPNTVNICGFCMVVFQIPVPAHWSRFTQYKSAKSHTPVKRRSNGYVGSFVSFQILPRKTAVRPGVGN